MLRIAFVTLGYPPQHSSGLAVGSERLVHMLLEAGHTVTVIAAGNRTLPETHHHPALRIIRLPLDHTDWITYAARAARLVQKLVAAQQLDLAHFAEVHFAYAYHKPFVAQLHHSFRQRINITSKRDPHTLVRRAYYLLSRTLAEKPALRRAIGLLAASTAVRDEYINHYGIAPSRIALVPYGLDTEHFRPDQEARQWLRHHLGIADDEPVVLFVGFVTPRKGLDYLAQALPLVNPMPRLVIAGRWSDDYRERFLNQLGNHKGRLIEAGFVADAELPAYYAMADVYVSPSLLEGFGLTLAEALACGTPVVAARGGSVAEVVGPGGIVVSPAESQALADGLNTLLVNPVVRYKLGMLGRAHIEQNFGLVTMRSAILESYHRFVAPVR